MSAQIKNEAIVDSIAATPEFQKSNIGAKSAWKGFGLQTLYIAKRIIDNCDEDALYMPETIEDLTIQFPQSNSTYEFELVQIKALGEPLTLSNLNPSKEDSFFKHVQAMRESTSLKPKVVVFGKVGIELLGFTKKKEPHFSSISSKLTALNYSEDFCSWLSDNLSFEVCEEGVIQNQIFMYLAETVECAASPELALSYLTDTVSQYSRLQRSITKNLWINRIRDIGCQISALGGWVSQYGKTIIPTSNYLNLDLNVDTLEEQYRQGANAQLSHIELGLDLHRPKWMEAIETAFTNASIVIIKGASGQGKSTLAYRFLRDYVLLENSFVIERTIDHKEASNIAAALDGLAKNTKNCCYVYMDDPKGTDWLWLCEQIDKRGQDKIKLLVSIREDDYSRSGFDKSRVRCNEIELLFDELEASSIYHSYETSAFSSFDDAWLSFGKEGPLLEFVYSLFNEVSLKERLHGQVESILHTPDPNASSWLYALAIICLAGEKGLSVDAARLFSEANLINPLRMMDVFEKEHLAVRETGSSDISVLHPYRAKLLAVILNQKIPIKKEDLLLSTVISSSASPELIIIEHFFNNGMSPKTLSRLIKASKDSWRILIGTLKALLWADTKDLFTKSENLREKFKSKSIPSSLFFMLSGGISGYGKEIDDESVKHVISILRPHESSTMNNLFEETCEYRVEYEYTDQLLRSLEKCVPELPNTDSNLSSVGFCLSWLSMRGEMIEEPTEQIKNLIAHVPPDMNNLESYLDLMVGLQMQKWTCSETLRDVLSPLVFEKHRVAWLNVKDTEIDGLVLYNAVDSNEGLIFNDVVVEAIAAFRRLYYEKDYYHIKMIGQESQAPFQIPDCEKNIHKDDLPLQWHIQLNIWFNLMCDYYDRKCTAARGIGTAFRGIGTSFFELSGNHNILIAAKGNKPLRAAPFNFVSDYKL